MNAASDSPLGGETPAPWSRTIAAIEWAERSKNLFEFSDEIEKALEEDYFQSPSFYTEDVLDALAGCHVLILSNDITGVSPELIISFVHSVPQSKEK